MTVNFKNDEQSHQHSLHTLETLYEYDDFMESVTMMADLGCGSGLDLEWWATRETRDDTPRPLNIQCTGIDLHEKLPMAKKYRNMRYQWHNFEEHLDTKNKFDVLWCHDSFQYVIDPFKALKNWWSMMSPDGMLVIIVPQTTNLEFNTQAFDQRDGCYHHWTLVNLIHTLAVSGFDCANGFFQKKANDPWLHAVVYKSPHSPMDPRTTSWLELAERGLIPKSAADSFSRYGLVKQRDLVLPWLDRSLESFAKH
jgi:SAM-dependent methyltransferase